MILRVPSYYPKFACIADRCQHSCCIGWEIDIDEDTLDYYNSLEGELGERIRSHIYEEDGFHSFVLQEGRRCPMLTEKNLCSIVLAEGEEALSIICTEFPRYTLEFGNVREDGLSLSCEEAARIVFSEDEPMTIVEQEIPGMYDDSEEADEEDEEIIRSVQKARDRILNLLQDRSRSTECRMNDMLAFGRAVQRCLGDNDPAGILALAGSWEPGTETDPLTASEFPERMDLLADCEILDEEWREFAQKLQLYYEETGEEGHRSNVEEFGKAFPEEEKAYEKILVSFAYRYLMKSVYDSQFLAKCQLAVLSTMLIRDMDVLRFVENGTYRWEDRMDTVRIYTREVEHSEENLASIQEAFLFGG